MLIQKVEIWIEGANILNDKIKNMSFGVDDINKSVNQELKKSLKNWRVILLYIPMLVFLANFLISNYIYFSKIKKIENQNELLTNRVDNTFWLVSEEKKLWYDAKTKELYIHDNKWFQDYKKKLKTQKNKK
ncbi:MAG: hypothetical protein ACRCVS_03780 [Fusobacteriaceae bacterium]